MGIPGVTRRGGDARFRSWFLRRESGPVSWMASCAGRFSNTAQGGPGPGPLFFPPPIARDLFAGGDVVARALNSQFKNKEYNCI